MLRSVIQNRDFYAWITPLVIIAITWIIIQSSAFSAHSEVLSSAVTVDVLLVSPLLFLGLTTRKKNAFFMLPIFVIGMVFLSYVLPDSGKYLLNHIEIFFLPVIEVVVLGFLIWNVRRIVRETKKQKEEGLDFYHALERATSELLPKMVARIFSVEISVLYYSFVYRKKKNQPSGYTYHKNTSVVATFITVLLLVIVETFVLHIWISTYSKVIAYVLSGISIYTGFQLLGFLRSVFARPILFASEFLRLRFGILGEMDVPYDSIESIEQSERDLEDEGIPHICPATVLSGGHNFILHLTEPIDYKGLYGYQKNTQKIAFYIDEKEAFAEELVSRMRKS